MDGDEGAVAVAHPVVLGFLGCGAHPLGGREEAVAPEQFLQWTLRVELQQQSTVDQAVDQPLCVWLRVRRGAELLDQSGSVHFQL
nr:hypothetical protein [Salinispora arenicola]